MENAQNFAAVISSMVLGPSFFDYFLSFSFFLTFSHVFHFLGLGRGDVFPKYGVGRCFPIFRDGGRGVFSPIWGLGGWGSGLGVGGVFPPP